MTVGWLVGGFGLAYHWLGSGHLLAFGRLGSLGRVIAFAVPWLDREPSSKSQCPLSGPVSITQSPAHASSLAPQPHLMYHSLWLLAPSATHSVPLSLRPSL